MLHGTFHAIPLVLHNSVGAALLSVATLPIVYLCVLLRLSAVWRDTPEEVNVHVLISKGDLHSPTKNALGGLATTAVLAITLMAFFVHGFVMLK